MCVEDTGTNNLLGRLFETILLQSGESFTDVRELFDMRMIIEASVE